MSEIKLDIPNITVLIDKGDQYKVVVNNPGSVVRNVTGSYIIAANTALTSSYALSASYVAGGTIASASYAYYSTTASYAANAFLPDGVVSSSAQIQLDQISGTTFNTQSYTFPQDLTVGGTLSADRLLVSSSVIYSSGSTKFGDSPDDTHEFTGSVSIKGPVSASSGFTGSFKGDGSQLTGIVSSLQITGSTGQDIIDLKTQGLLITGSNGINTTVTDNTVTIIAPAGTVTNSAQINVFDTTGGDNVATLGANNFYGDQKIYGDLEIHTGNLVVTSGNTLLVSGAIFAQNEIVAGFVSSSQVVATSITGSFKGDGSQLTGLVTDLRISGSVGSDTLSLLTDDLTITGQHGIVTTITDNTVTIDVPHALTASLYGTASVAEGIDIVFAGNYELGNDPPVALQVGGTGNIISASYALTASYANNAVLPPGVLSSSTQVIYTQIPNIPLGMISTSAQFNNLSNTSASYALTASYVTNLPTIDTGSFAVTASNVFTDSQVISGALTTTGNITANNLSVTYNVSAPGYVDTPLLYHGGPMEIRSYYSPLQVNSNGAGILLNDNVGITGSINLISGSVVGDTIKSTVNGTPIQINYGITKGDFANRFGGIKIKNYQWSGANLASQIEFWTDSEAQDYSTRRFYIDGFGKSIFTSNVEVTGSLTISGSSTLTNIGPAIFSGSLNVTNGITGSLQGTSSWAENVKFNNLSGLPTGLISSSTQIATALPAGTISSSTQIVNGIAGQTIAPANVNATGTVSGSSIQASGNSSIGGNLTVTGTITATSQSIQYVTSSQFDVSTNKILVNTDNSLRFGGISVVDSGSVNHTGSLYWDSLNDRWVYERTDGSPYNSAIVVAGPENFGTLGNERGLIVGRVPTATGDDHIDTAPQSSSIRIDFVSGRTDVEHGLYVTGSLDATGTVRLAGIPSSSGQIQPLLPGGTISSSGQISAALPAGTISSSGQVSYTGLSNIPSGILSSSTQINALSGISASYAITASYALNSTTLPAGTISSSTQVDYNSIQNKLSGVVSSSIQIQPLLPNGTISSSTQLPAGTISSSTQVSYTQLQNIPSGIVSSSTQVQPLLPGGVVSSSAQYPGWVTSSTQVNTGSFSGSFIGTLSGTITSASYAITASYAQSATATVPAGTVSSSTQVKADLPDGVVSSSAQYPGWVTSSTQIVWSSVNYNSGIVSSSTQVQPLLPAGTVSSSTQTKANLPAGTISSSLQFNNLTSPFTGSFTGSFTGLINSSSYVLPAGLPGGLVSSSTQIASFGTIRLQIATNRSNASAFYFNANTRTSSDSASPTADTAFLIQSTGLTTITVYLRQDNAGPNATVVGFAKNANATAFSTATLVASSSLSLTGDTIQTYTFSGHTLNQFDSIHIYCDPASTPGTLYGVVVVS